jgi:hypothetical protein
MPNCVIVRGLQYASDIKVIVLTGEGGNFCSGGDVHEIIGPLTEMSMPELLDFTRMTGDLVKAMRHCPQPIIAAIDGICVGAGAILAMAADMRYARDKNRFLFTGRLAGCDMGVFDFAAHHQRVAPVTIYRAFDAPMKVYQGFTTAFATLMKFWLNRWKSRNNWRDPPSPTVSPRKCCIRNGQ